MQPSWRRRFLTRQVNRANRLIFVVGCEIIAGRWTYIAFWIVLLLAYPLGTGVASLLFAPTHAHNQDAAGAAIAGDLGAIFSVILAVVSSVVIGVSTGVSVSQSRAWRSALRALPWLFVVLVTWASFFAPKHASQLRSDLSATITYVGEHEEIVLDCTDMYGSFGNRRTEREEVVEIDSVRDDGRIVIAWGRDYNSKQKKELNVGPSIPKDGPPVVVEVTLTDTEATYVVRQR